MVKVVSKNIDIINMKYDIVLTQEPWIARDKAGALGSEAGLC